MPGLKPECAREHGLCFAASGRSAISAEAAITLHRRSTEQTWRLLRHLGAHLRAQLVDQAKAFVGLDVPEGPAVAGLGPLRQRADAVNRADLVAKRDRAVGAYQRTIALARVHQFGPRRDDAALD